MTGTSCDGLDLAYIITNGSDQLKLGPSTTIAFSNDYRNRLRNRVTAGLKYHCDDHKLAKDIASYHA